MTYARDLRLETFRLSQDGGVLTARYESPPLNFMTSAFVDDWDLLTRTADRDRSVGAVILTGAPDERFITHFDVEELAAAGRTPAPPLTPFLGALVVRAGILSLRVPGGRAAWLRFGGPLGRSLVTLAKLHASILRMHRSGVVYIAAINGPCLGGGLEMALACDLRFAADVDVVRLGQIEVLGGIIPGAGGTQHLPRVVGTAKAIELVLEGRALGAKEALEAGLVNRVVPADDLLVEASETGLLLATRSRTAVAAAKTAIYGGASRPLAAGLYVEAGGLVASGTTVTAKRLAGLFADDVARLGDSPFVAAPATWYRGRLTD